MVRVLTPVDLWSNAFQAAMIVAEAQAVIAMRMWGLAGIWSVTPSENSRMVSEKAFALTRAATDAGTAALRGRRADQVVAAAMKPIRQKTRANARRLAKRGYRKR
ncbi:antifreeze protein [Roseovarius atlanticus]|uniref:antifreeze protein n=1 Tax=Roseovarius atlanticus TaxID=1641875 RepID=UPI001C97DEF2|nr:antifreeze protein [Roseovarius atlanticus]MBY5989456.1 antifreeze protein [Roseovarius atlanticus]MBY6124848.1 antifreeze protein [Roseovarius atlanticus]MBY6149343.1 antifreeze protein [Roseovarius atlanticus]